MALVPPLLQALGGVLADPGAQGCVSRGGEIIQDLNEPVAPRLEERYAIVIDAGTLEHCFNIGEAVRFSPTWYHDFYESNGFEVERLDIVWNAGQSHAAAAAPPFSRFQQVPDGSMLLAVARRREVRDIRWPIQKKYRDAPTLGT